MSADGQQFRWWLESGPETCAFCEVRYNIEAACYCVECDRPVCPACFVEIRVTRRIYCPDCAPTDGEREVAD